MTQKLDNARKIYIEGIRDGDTNAVHRYTGSRYVQHSTGVKDGQKGFIEFFQNFLERSKQRDIRIVRAFEDGNYVFVHVYQNINNGESQWVTTDMFDTDENDKLVEHWDVISAYKAPEETASGNDPVLGDFHICDLDKTEENKSIVRKFITDIFQNKNYEHIRKYISEDNYIQHNPSMPNGVDALEKLLTTQKVDYNFVFKIIGQGNHVVTYSKVTINDEELAVFDIFRLEKGRIVEHWDNMEKIPAHKDLVNSGKF
ncbi:nuclear transport factor 2 family protein [Rothia sp. P4278]|uniref:nuclear transport factor 2 family protein n=1 Tax=Rothia sp. P4278 TaxID=3402658 RepID=UPI003ADC00D4